MKENLKNTIKSKKILMKIFAQIKMVTAKSDYQTVFELIKQYYGEEVIKDKKYVNKTIKDAFFCVRYYKVTFKEYFVYNFKDFSDEKRKEFIGDIERNEILAKLAKNNENNVEILHNKYKTYLKFQDYYKRDIIRIRGKEDKAKFEEFCKKHSTFLVKPNYLWQGLGVYKVNQSNYKELDVLWNEILKYDESILEELIIQSDELSIFHPKSVNTIRFTTYTHNDKCTNLSAVLRMGKGDSIVDNASAGGIAANINLETGIINTIGKTYNGDKYLKHPDTNVCFLGYQIPKWDELCQMAEIVAKKFQEYSFIAWDFALTNTGWIIVEANQVGGLELYQQFGNGLRTKYKEALK